MPFSSHHIWEDMVPTWHHWIIGEVDLHHWVKMLFAEFLHCTIMVFHLPALFFISESLSQPCLQGYKAEGWSHGGKVSICIILNCLIKKIYFLFLLIHLSILVWICIYFYYKVCYFTEWIHPKNVISVMQYKYFDLRARNLPKTYPHHYTGISKLVYCLIVV